jgi:regulator of protease activity HflC (stomatin/prohibitin superfamily)
LRDGFGKDPYRGVVLLLLAASFLGMLAAFIGNAGIADPLLLDAALTLGLSAGVLLGVAAAQAARAEPPAGGQDVMPPEAGAAPAPQGPEAAAESFPLMMWRGLQKPEGMRGVAVYMAVLGSLAVFLLLFRGFAPGAETPRAAAIAAFLCLLCAGLFGVAARYLAPIDPGRFPEAAWLGRGARVIAWIMVLAAASVGLLFWGQCAVARLLHIMVLAVDAAVCYGLFSSKRNEEKAQPYFPLEFSVLFILGSRPNILGSILDSAEQQLGIDLRSTWALTVVRHGLEPLIAGLCLLGWLSTSLTVVGVDEQGLVEHLGVPAAGAPLASGLHLHWPWPVDRVYRVPVLRVQNTDVGHPVRNEGGGPENVLWAVEHDPSEYSLLLGNGRDLVSIDASVQYRIVDARAWHYRCNDPAAALSAIAYRAVMRATVGRTLSEVLAENRTTFTEQMLAMVQKDADGMGLGVRVVGFMVGAMHPPVPVAPDYEAVVSAQIGKVTAVVSARASRNQLVPAAQAEVIESTSAARAEGIEKRAIAAGEAWSFRTLEAQYRAEPQDYFFRRRLEILERDLAGRGFTVIDARFQRDGGELWLTQ